MNDEQSDSTDAVDEQAVDIEKVGVSAVAAARALVKRLEQFTRFRQSRPVAADASADQAVRVVFAESCTCGMVAATLGQIPGVSNWLCGSMVTYQAAVKQQWLAVSEGTLLRFSAESLETTRELAAGVLARTDSATIAAAVTGHLGPDAPAEIDGHVFIAVAARLAGSQAGEAKPAPTIEMLLERTIILRTQDRVSRQLEAASSVLELTAEAIASLLGCDKALRK